MSIIYNNIIKLLEHFPTNHQELAHKLNISDMHASTRIKQLLKYKLIEQWGQDVSRGKMFVPRYELTHKGHETLKGLIEGKRYEAV